MGDRFDHNAPFKHSPLDLHEMLLEFAPSDRGWPSATNGDVATPEALYKAMLTRSLLTVVAGLHLPHQAVNPIDRFF
jgi:hypothetical protein